MAAEATDSKTAPGTDLTPIAAVRPPAIAKTQVRRAPPIAATAATEEDHAHGFPVDRLLHAWQARFFNGLSPAAITQAYADWAIHLANQPGKQADLVRKSARKWLRFLDYARKAPFDVTTPPGIEPLPGDRRFTGEDWRPLPFSLLAQGFLFTQQWWHNATTGIRGVDPRHAEIVHFAARQVLDALSPSNFLPTNPEVLRVTAQTGGRNLWDGFQNWLEDAERALLDRPPAGAEAFQAGRDVAVTPGKVVYRNRLIELIQYTPATESVHTEPVLIVPAWIMKYYILDLSPHNSMVRYLVERGHTVFMISWKNPTEADRDLGLEAYLELGPLAAIDTIRAMLPNAPQVHGVGYCLGGTLLTIAAACLARECDTCLKTVTLFAAQADFTEAGELMLFINPSQVAWLEDMMWDQGYLDTRQMAGAFQLLRSNDLVWSANVRHYLLGERPAMSDLMAWNADATRMPFRMHSEYLRKLFLDNDLAEGRFRVRGGPVSLADIKIPVFAVATRRDHIAPWRSVYKITWLAEADTTFVLTDGGHNAGIVSPPGDAPPGRNNRVFHLGDVRADGYHIDADTWLRDAAEHHGSWWPVWAEWLAQHSDGMVPARPAGGGGALDDAPGNYVRER